MYVARLTKAVFSIHTFLSQNLFIGYDIYSGV